MSEKYTDYDIDFPRNSFTGDISLRKEAASIRQSVLNIIMTKPGEKPFNRGFGVGMHRLLFENFSDLDIAVLKSTVQSQLISFEPRVIFKDLIVNTSAIDNNELNVEVVYTILKETDIASSPEDRVSIAVTKVR